MSSKISYSLIAKGTKPLVDYIETPYTFIAVTSTNYLTKVEQNATKAFANNDGYIYFYTNESDITVMIVADRKYPKATAVCCLNSIKREFLEKYQKKNLNSTKILGLNYEFRDKLKEKINFFNTHLDYDNEEYFEKLKYLDSLKNNVIGTSHLAYERGQKINQMSQKSDQLAGKSEAYYQGAKRVAQESKKDMCLIM